MILLRDCPSQPCHIQHEWEDWHVELFLWDPRWSATWDEVIPELQMIPYQHWFSIIARVNNYLVILYLSYTVHPDRQGAHVISKVFFAEIRLGEIDGSFTWSIEVAWHWYICSLHSMTLNMERAAEMFRWTDRDKDFFALFVRVDGIIAEDGLLIWVFE